ncbi:MAG TPA: TIGR03862 family flavoprotein [Dokdonella sp.]|nr:TIGR03862 family flavoprotein [Dokdonella sp.]
MTQPESEQRSRTNAAIIGGGPAGLMAAETARAAGVDVDVYDRMGSVGRKFLIAGKGGLNLTHSDPFEAFVSRYRERADEVGAWLREFDADALRAWARGLGVETFVGTSGRVFPRDLKAAPLLRGWVRRLRASGVRFHVHHEWTGWDAQGGLRFSTPDGERSVESAAVVLACGGGSWPILGSDGRWIAPLAARGIAIAPLQPSNCGFDVTWSAHFAGRHAGEPVKAVVLECEDAHGTTHRRQGEFVVGEHGIEGSLVYAFSAILRDAIAAHGRAVVRLDLAPGRDVTRLTRELARPHGRRSVGEHLRRAAGIEGVKAGLLYEALGRDALADPERVAATLKALPLTLQRARPLDEAISSAGGVRFEALDERLMLRDLPGMFCAGEMIDWEAPTGGYLLTACFASGRIAGAAAADWIVRMRGATVAP